jgi:hypothetical protein
VRAQVRYIIVLLLLLTLWRTKAGAQDMYASNRYTYISGFVGPSQYLGDIGNQTNNFWGQYRLQQNTWFGGASIQRVYNNKLSVELQYTIGRLAAADRDINFANAADPNYLLYQRNLDFRTNISEFALNVHAMPLAILFARRKVALWKAQPYITVGGGTYKFKPQGSVYDAVFNKTIWYDLPAYSTEGQGFAEYPSRQPYALRQYNIQYGFGIHYNLSSFYYCAVGTSGRKLFTDYLDDVSSTYIEPTLYNRYLANAEEVEIATLLSNKSVLVNPFAPYPPGEMRGNSNKYDAYYSLYFKFGFRIGVKKGTQATHYKYDDTEICD